MMNFNIHTPYMMVAINKKLLICCYSRFVLMQLNVVKVVKIVDYRLVVFHDGDALEAYLIAVERAVGNQLFEINV